LHFVAVEVAFHFLREVGVGPELFEVEVTFLRYFGLDFLVELLGFVRVECRLVDVAPGQLLAHVELGEQGVLEVVVDGGPHGALSVFLALESDLVLDLELHLLLEFLHDVFVQGFVETHGRLVLIDVELVGVEDFGPPEWVVEVKLDDGRVEVLTVEPNVAFVEDHIDGGVGTVFVGDFDEIVFDTVALHVHLDVI